MFNEEIKGKLEKDERFIDVRINNPTPEKFFTAGKDIGNYVRENLQRQNRSIDNVLVLVGGDSRILTPSFVDTLILGVNFFEIPVANVGYNRTTPSVEWAGREYGAYLTAVVTASHYGPEKNGVKITINPKAISGLQKDSQKKPIHLENAVQDAYKESLRNASGDLHGISIAVDCMNGTSSGIFESIAVSKGARVYAIRDVPNGNFPDGNHEPDPTQYENIATLRQVVKNSNVSFGVAFDGDGDRLVVLTEKGELIPPEYLGLVFAKSLCDNGGYTGSVILENKLMFIEDAIKNFGQSPVFVKTGRPYLIKGMEKENADFGYELSGHLFFRNWLDDAMKNALYLAQIVRESNKPISLLVDEACSGIPYNIGEVRFDFDKTRVTNEIEGLRNNSQYVVERYEDSRDDLLLTDGESSVYLRPSAHANIATVVPWGFSKNKLNTFLNSAFGNISKDFADAFRDAYAKTAVSKASVFYQPRQLILASQR